MMKKYSKITFLITILTLINLIGCTVFQDLSLEVEFLRLEQLLEPKEKPWRTAEMPLVAAIPGLNLPGVPTGAA